MNIMRRTVIPNNNFSKEHFYSLLKEEIREQKKFLIIWFVAIYAALTIIAILEYLYFESGDINACVSPYNTNYIYVPFWLCFFGSVFASFMIASMNNKSNQSISLNSPSTTLEKYLTRLFVVVILFPIEFIVALKLFDYTRMLFFSLYYSESVYPESLVEMINKCHDPVLELSVGLLIQSIFILGTTIWCKKSFLKTAVILFILFIVLAMVDSQFGLFISRIFDKMNWLIKILIFLTLTLLNWKLGYSKFKKIIMK